MSDVYILDGVRTPIGRLGGELSALSAVTLGERVVSELVKRNSLAAGDTDQLIFGNVLQAGLGQNMARQIAVKTLSQVIPAFTVNMVCGSGLHAVCLGALSIKAGESRCVVTGGSESMSNAPYLLSKARFGYRMGHGELTDSVIRDGLWDCFNDYHMGITAENLVEKYGISRQDQDEFSALSQQKAAHALAENRFDAEMVSVMVPAKKGEVAVMRDEGPRSDVTAVSLAQLKPVFKKDGTVTAGNASGVNDGAAAVILADKATAVSKGNTPLGRVVSWASAGVDPAVMGIGPVSAIRKALDKAGWTLEEVDLIESNEAFAAQSLAVGRELRWDWDRVNVNGGAIALGHPIGASGARILVTLLYEMERRGVSKGLAALCIGGGMGIAMCVER